MFKLNKLYIYKKKSVLCFQILSHSNKEKSRCNGYFHEIYIFSTNNESMMNTHEQKEK
jgi:hypothetical protein